MKKFKQFTEDVAAPTNAVGGGAIAGLGVGPQGEPGIPGRILRRKKPKEIMKSFVPTTKVNEDAFMGHKVFEVDSDVFHKSTFGKKKYSRWNKATGNNEPLASYGKKSRKPIIISDKRTGAMYFFRHPKDKKVV